MPVSARGQRNPNVLITGTPGTGKTSICTQLCEDLGLKHLNVSDITKEHNFHQGFDKKRDCHIIDEDKLCDYLEDQVKGGNCIVDSHTLVDYFPERWFDYVVVLTTDNTILYDRLAQRGYSQAKITENVECEIMSVILEEARESYAEDKLVVLQNDNTEHLEQNIAHIKKLLSR